MLAVISLLALALTVDDMVEILGILAAIVLALWRMGVVKLARSRANTAETEEARAKWNALIDRIDRVVPIAVRATEQTMARELRSAHPEPGTLTVSQGVQAFGDAMRGTLAHFGSELPAMAQAAGVSRSTVEELIRQRIEAAVLELKRSRAPTLAVVRDFVADPEADTVPITPGQP